jgi:hypothetical protein
MQTRSNNKNLRQPVDHISSKGKQALNDVESDPEMEVDVDYLNLKLPLTISF